MFFSLNYLGVKMVEKKTWSEISELSQILKESLNETAPGRFTCAITKL